MPGKTGAAATEARDMFGSPLLGSANPFFGYPKKVHWLGAASRAFPLYISCAPGDGELLNMADGEDSWLITGAESGEASLEPVLA